MAEGPDPKFGDSPEWNLIAAGLAPNVPKNIAVLNFADVPSDWRLTAKTIAMAMLRQLRAHVVANFEDVGTRFPEEARRIHYGESEEREIYGRATLEEAKELLEEGISVRPLPDVPELDG